MLSAYQIYDKTNQGLQIILDLVPQAGVAVENQKKSFKYRPDERTASAYLIAPDANHPYWRLIDYGISNHAFTPADLYIREKGMTSNQFSMACHELAEKYGIEDEKTTQSNRPVWNDRPASEGEQEGQRVFEVRESFTDDEIRLWGPNVTAEHLRSYGWKPAVYVGTVRNGRVKECRSTETYPIFIEECHYNDKDGKQQTFYKVYKPREYNKKYRFEYIGKVPKDYMYGLEALQCAFRKNGEKKLSSVFLVSGGSDAVNALSMGGQAVWLNSETADLTKPQHSQLYEYANRIYVIGDVDTTGKECSRKLAMRFLDTYRVLLPEQIMNRFHDARGNRRKDLKDYCQICPNREDFWNLVHQSRRGKFWFEVEDGKNGTPIFKVSPTALSYFLELHGYYTLRDENHERPRYIYVDGIQIKEVFPKDIKNFLNTWCQKHALPEALQNVIRRSKDLPNKETSNLQELDLSFVNATSTSQICYFRNCWIEVTADGIKKHNYKELTPLGAFVWKHDVIQHDYVDHKPMFIIQQHDDGGFGITLTDDAKSDVLTYLVHTSRLYWRQEDEQGIPLTDQQKQDEEQCLVAKLACIGYYLYRFKSESMAWAAILQDAFLSEDEHSANGRSGKSFFLRFLQCLVNTFSIDGRKADIHKKPFLFDGVTASTDMVKIDECAFHFMFSFFFGMITGSIKIEEKNKHQFDIPFAEAAKFIFATNYVIKNIDSSTQARLWPQVFSDYYHSMAPNNDYKQDRSIRDDFGYNLLGSEYPEEKWQADIAFAMQCLQFYLSLPASQRKIMPPMDAIKRRTQRAIIGKSFEDWAKDYYKTGEGHLDVTEDYDAVLANYRKETEDRTMSPRTFTKKLKEFCSYADHIHCYNPGEFTENKEDGDRIRERRDGMTSKVPMIHVRSVAWVESHTEDSSQELKEPSQLDLFDDGANQDPFLAASELDDDDVETF